MRWYCNNQDPIHIAKNPVFHEHSNQSNVDCHIVRQKVVDEKIIQTRQV